MRGVVWVLALAACGDGGTTPTATGDDDDGVQCEPAVYVDLTIEGRVTEGGVGAEGATVRLEERNWAPTTLHGTTTTGANGTFSLDATDLPIVEGCWGWATGFWLVAERGGLSDEYGANTLIVNGWLDGASVVRLDAVDLALE